MMNTASTAAILVLLSGLVAGCQARALVPSEADAFRDQIRSLNGRIAALEQANSELKAELAATSPDQQLAEVQANIPMPVRLKVGWGAAVEPAADAAGRGTLRLYLETLDGRGHFVQATGWLEVTTFSMPPSPSQPVGLGGVALKPSELRDRYRSGLTGTHYTIETPIDLRAAAGAETVLAHVTYRDGISGETLRASTVVPLPRQAANPVAASPSEPLSR